MLDRTAVGRKSPPTLHEVERGAIRRFAQSLGDVSPLYFDLEHARAAGFSNVPAPPSFPLSFTNGPDLRELLGVPLRSLLLADLHWEFERTMVAGDRILVSARIAEVGERPGPTGLHEVALLEDEGRDDEGRLVYRGRRTYVFRPTRDVS